MWRISFLNRDFLYLLVAASSQPQRALISTMKTAAALLQEVMVQLGKVPEYVLISQTGPPHQAKFEYCCSANGLTTTAVALSKKDAKQEAARIMLLKLAECGVTVPSTLATTSTPYKNKLSEHSSVVTNSNYSTLPRTASAAPAPEPSYVSLLNEFSTEHRLPAPHYELCAAAGPPHLRHFTVRATIAGHHRAASSTTKKSARQLAAQQLYTYLKENLEDIQKQAKQADALAPAHDTNCTQQPPAAHGQHLDLDVVIQRCLQSLRSRKSSSVAERSSQPANIYIDAGRRPAVLAALQAHREEPPERALAAVAAALGLRVERRALPTAHGELVVLELWPAAPPLAMAARDAPAAAAAALRCLCRVIACPLA